MVQGALKNNLSDFSNLEKALLTDKNFQADIPH
jgi:hypothetical protein